MRKIIECVPKPFWKGLLIGCLVGAIGWVGESDYQQAVASAEFYCEMSARGDWPVRPELGCPVPEVQPGQHLVAL
ncbi:MAG: hypothetical protein K0S85_94 [Pseudomonas orientalis]|nr:hypothetical protein [Pseudomonas orientalis]